MSSKTEHAFLVHYFGTMPVEDGIQRSHDIIIAKLSLSGDYWELYLHIGTQFAGNYSSELTPKDAILQKIGCRGWVEDITKEFSKE